jgi:polyisoprenoid-binding protein YceI
MRSVRSVRQTVLVAVLAAVMAMPFVGGGVSSWVAEAQEKAAKVSYAPIAGGHYNIDPAHSIIGFSIRHLEINWVEGRFKDFKGAIHFDDSDITKSSVEFTAKIESIDTGVEARDKHLRTADFFDAATHPDMTFRSARVERKAKDSYVLHGDLTIKGVTKQVQLPFTLTGAIKDPWGNTRFGINAQTRINRRDFGITWGKALENGGLDVGNEVTIDLQLEAVKPAPKPAGQ